VDKPNSPFGIGCECNNIPDGICPAIACGSDPDCAQCTPDCTGRTCGDNGCGGECGTCDVGKQCSALGQCEAICVPNCIDRQCGDDGCGGSCGTCDGTCRPDGTCDGTCVPTGCGGKECGTDGCTEGACGGCTDGLECSNDNLCDCPFFSTVKYTFTLAPQAGFPADFTSVALNLTHVGLKDALKKDGAVLGFATGQKQTFTMTVNGCRPKIRIKREYTLTGGSCVADQLITGRTDFTISPPTPQAGGGCTTTAL
ncbi:MAG: Tryptophan synthase alpha chain, partial [Deltaproteobacteria bacterium]|nr:Tryptophan synthase alpha chain [Deltaproteobacteria bacterium]